MEVDTVPTPSIKSEPSTSADTECSSKLGLCEVCAFHDAKYTCPRCEVKTCSLKCNKIHKLELECDGSRDRAKFVPLNKFTNLDLSSDYRLLEEMSRNLETVQKQRQQLGISNHPKDIQPTVLYKLQKAARQLKVNLMFLPQRFARRKTNTTRLEYKTDLILWHVEWIFVNADNLKLHDERLPETEKLSAVLSKYFSEQADEKLQFYKAAGLSGVKLFLKAEQRQGKKFYELDMGLSIKESLRKKLIIEYPTIHVLLKDHGYGYDVVDSDDDEEVEDEKNVKSGNEVLDSIIKHNEDEESVYESLKNLLFISEYSEEEM